MEHPTTRYYPACCTSGFCGRATCDGCRNLPILLEFKAWVAATDAHKPDPTWLPTFWRARRAGEGTGGGGR